MCRGPLSGEMRTCGRSLKEPGSLYEMSSLLDHLAVNNNGFHSALHRIATFFPSNFRINVS